MTECCGTRVGQKYSGHRAEGDNRLHRIPNKESGGPTIRIIFVSGDATPPETMIQACQSSLFQRDGVSRNFIKGRHRLGIGFEATLRHDQVGEFGGDVDVR